MKSNYKFADIIEEVNKHNSDLKYGLNDIVGVTIEKGLIPTVANLTQTALDKFYLVEPNTFVYNPRTHGVKLGMGYNKTNETFITSWNNVAFRVKPSMLDLVNPDYLWMYFCRDEWDRETNYYAWGSSTIVFSWNTFLQIEIEIPSKETQDKIVRHYNTITNRIALKKKINEDLVASLSTVYKELFSDAETQYSKVPLQKICTKIGSGATPKGGKTAYIDEGISLIRSTNVFDFRFEYSDLAHINQTQADALSNVTVEPNDVLFNITGVSVARCCMVPDDVLPARVNQHVMIVRPVKGVAMSYYIMFTLCSAGNKAKLLGIGQSGSTREAINKQELESFEIPIPDDDSLNKFGEIALCAYKNIQCNVKEIRLLEDMTSVLLAQLSSH